MKYEDLPFLPWMIAETVCGEEYKMQEFSEQSRSVRLIKEIEAKRIDMTPEQIKEFSTLCDARCKKAFESKAAWFMKLVAAKDNSGRDQLYTWIRHWMVSYLNNRHNFIREAA